MCGWGEKGNETGIDGNFKVLKWKVLRGRGGRENVRKCVVREVECHGGKVQSVLSAVRQ